MPPGETDRGILQGLAAAELGGVSGGDESLGESPETPFVFRTLALVRASWLP